MCYFNLQFHLLNSLYISKVQLNILQNNPNNLQLQEDQHVMYLKSKINQNN